MLRGGNAQERAADAQAGECAAAATTPERAEAELDGATIAARAAVSQLETLQRSFERLVGGDLEAARAAIRGELAAAALSARVAAARLEAAQRCFAQLVFDDWERTPYGAAPAEAPREAGEACAHGASLVRSTWAEEAQSDPALWLASAPVEPNLEQGPRSEGFFTEAFQRVFDPRRPEGPPTMQAAPSEGGRFPEARPMHRCTWCHQPIRGVEPVVCAFCDAVFCPDCTWPVEDGSEPERQTCGCNERDQDSMSRRASRT